MSDGHHMCTALSVALFLRHHFQLFMPIIVHGASLNYRLFRHQEASGRLSTSLCPDLGQGSGCELSKVFIDIRE